MLRGLPKSKWFWGFIMLLVLGVVGASHHYYQAGVQAKESYRDHVITDNATTASTMTLVTTKWGEDSDWNMVHVFPWSRGFDQMPSHGLDRVMLRYFPRSMRYALVIDGMIYDLPKPLTSHRWS